MNRDIRSMLPDEVRLAYLDQEVDALSLRLRDERHKASTARLQSAMLGMIELLRDRKFSLLLKVARH
jgi:hypothetical protein